MSIDEVECVHEAIPLASEPFVDASPFPRAGSSSYTTCKHCGAPLRVRRSPQVRMTIWGWREMMGFDPYDQSKWPEEQL
jgi:hypothetical protein